MLARFRPTLHLMVIMMAIAATLSAQSTTAKLFGVIYDSQKLVLPGAAVHVQNFRTGHTRSTVSNSDGYFELQSLPPGEYEVTWELAGFATGKSRLRLELNQQARLDLEMRVGEVQSTVIVEAAPPLLNSQDATLGIVVDQNTPQFGTATESATPARQIQFSLRYKF